MNWRNILKIARLFIFVFLICGTAQPHQANAGAIGKALVATGAVAGVAVGSVITEEIIGAAVVAALIAAEKGRATPAYSNAITNLKMVLAAHRIIGKYLANKALNSEVAKDPSLAEKANQVRADAGLSPKKITNSASLPPIGPNDEEPDDEPRLYRGGNSLEARKIDVQIDKTTGLVKPTRGVSLSTDEANMVQRYGEAKEIGSIPDKLQIIRTSGNHYEIAPRSPMTMEEYQELLNQVTFK